MTNRPKSQQATIILFQTRFQVTGPVELIVLTQAIISSKSSEEEKRDQVEDLFSDWYVFCTVTGEQITLDQLRYWDVERQECYARPDVVPNRFWTKLQDPRPELREYWAKRQPERVSHELETSSVDQEQSSAAGNGDDQGRHVEASDFSGNRVSD